MLTFGSLFAGIGGMDLGLERAGMKCVWQVENNEYCQRVLAKHWPDVRRWDDVKTFDKIVTRYNEFDTPDLICGGDPCQANSAAAGPAPSKRESLGGEFLRVVESFRPRFVLRENPSHVRADAPWPWWKFRNGLESLGYLVIAFRLRACCLGADHRRDRLFLLGENADTVRLRVEGRNGQTPPSFQSEAAAPSLGPAHWNNVSAVRGYRSRSGIPDYVERTRALGNAVVPQVAEWIGRRIIEAVETTP